SARRSTETGWTPWLPSGTIRRMQRGAARSARWIAVASLLTAAHVRAAILDANFELSTLTTLDPGVTSMAWAPDGRRRLVRTNKLGQVQIVSPGMLPATTFVQLSPYTGSECGLLGIAFDPDYERNHFVYLFVTVQVDEQQIVRYRDADNVGVEPTTIVAHLPT